jgi:glycerophosphoryl diester phosphodiesterase
MNLDRTKITITGHRGAAGLAPENTLSAIREGMKYADRIEIDVHQSKDGRIIVMHDARVDRTTNGKGKIKNLDSTEIRKLDAGSWFSEKYIEEEVPFLEEVIDLVCPTKILLIEMKDGEYENFEENVLSIIKEKQVQERVIIQSFSTKILERIHKLSPKIKLHKLFVKKIHFFGIDIMIAKIVQLFNFKKYNYIKEYSVYHRFITKYFIKDLDKRTGGKMINTWVENDVKRAQKLIKKGIDGFITDYPNIFN